MDGRLRDIYGLPCCPDYEELLQTYTPLWLELDDCQTYGWQRFLYTAAQQLGVPLNTSSEQDGHLSLEDPASHAVVVAVLEQLLARGERHAPELWADLVKHVHNGIPTSLRPLIWPVLLRPAKTEPQQHVCWSAAQYKELLDLQKELFAAVKGSTPTKHKQDQHDQRSAQTAATAGAAATAQAASAAAVPGLKDLQAIVTASGLVLTSEQLVEWRVGCRTWASQIEKDVHRTFPGHEWLSSPAGQSCLTRLLSCFCLAAPHLGYCQVCMWVVAALADAPAAAAAAAARVAAAPAAADTAGVLSGQGMNYVAGSMLLLLGAGITCQQPPRRSSSSTAGPHSRQQSISSNSGGGSSSSSGAPQPQTPLSANGTPEVASNGTVAASTAAPAAGSRRTSASMLAPASSTGAATAAAGIVSLEQLEAVVFESLLGFAERVLPGYYSPAMVAPQVDQRVLSHLATEHLPALTARLTVLGLSPAQPCPAWLLAGFAASSMPLATVARLWDVAFFERSGAAFIRACLALLHLFSAAFDAALDCCDAQLLLQALPGLAFDSDRLLTLAKDAYSEVNPETLMALQHCFRAEVLAEIEQAAAAQRKQQAATPPRPARQTAAAAAGATSEGQAQDSPAGANAGPASGDEDAAAAAAHGLGDAGAGSVASTDASQGAAPAAEAGVADVTSTQMEQQGSKDDTGADCEPDAGSSSDSAAVVSAPSPVPWVPDFDEAAVAAAAAAAGGSAGGSAAGTIAPAAAAKQTSPAAVAGSKGAGSREQQQQSGVGEEDGVGEEEEEEETGSLLGPQQQQQQQRLAGGSRNSSRGASRSTSMTGRQSWVAAGSSGGALKTHSLEVSRSKAIAQAMSIAAVPGLPVLPCIAVSTPKQQQQQQQAHSGDGSAGRGGSFLRSLGVQRPSNAHAGPGSPSHQQQKQQLSVRSHSTGRPSGSAVLRAPTSSVGEGYGSGFGSGSFPLHHSYSSGDSPAGLSSMSAVRILSAAVDESSDFCEDVEGTGWMLLGGSSPRVAAAAAAAAAVAASGSNGSGSSSPTASGSPMAAAAAAAGCNVKVLCENLRDNYGLTGLTETMRELTAAVQGAEPAATALAADTAAGGSAQQDQGGSSAAGSNGGSNNGSSGGSSGGLQGRCLALAEAALAAAEQVVGDLAQQTASMTALQCQLDRSMGRLELQDSELASKDETIERLQQHVTYYESLSNGGSISTHSPKKNRPHHQQQQFAPGDQFCSSQDGSNTDGRNSQTGGRQRFGLRRQQQQQYGGEGEGVVSQGFVAAALARFGSPTKGRGPGRA